MGEILPVILGVALGALVAGLRGTLRTAALVTGTVLGALSAGLVTGELAQSAGFLLVDIPIVAMIAFPVAWTITRRRAAIAQ